MIVLLSVSNGQSVEYLTDCARGASFVSNASINSDGSILFVGDLGRVGIYTKALGRIAWECLPTQSFLYDVWSRNDTTIVAGEEGVVWYRIAADPWRSHHLPRTATLRTVAIHNGHVWVGSQEGAIWTTDDLRSGLWTLSVEASASIIDIVSSDGVLLALGRNGTLMELQQADMQWTDYSLPNSSLEFASATIVGKMWVIGADSGKVFRFHPNTNVWEQSQIAQPTSFTKDDGFRGRGDKTLCITETPNGVLIATGNFDGGSGEQGVKVSNDTGKSWRDLLFFAEFSDPDAFYAWYSPAVRVVGDSVIAVVCVPTDPISVLTSSLSLDTMRLVFQSDDKYAPLDTIIDLKRGRTTMYVQSVVVLESDSVYFTLQNHVPSSFAFMPAVEPISFMIRIRVNPDTVIHDTVSMLQGEFTTLFLHEGALYAGGDSGRIAVSHDDGYTWDVARIRDANVDKERAFRFFRLGNSLAAIATGTPLSTPGWKSRSVINQSDTGWAVMQVDAPTGYSVLPSDVDVAHDGAIALLATNVPSGSTTYSSVYTLDADKFVEHLKFDDNTFTDANIFFQGDTIGVTMMFNSTNPGSAFYLRCINATGQWLCDTVMLRSSSGITKLRSGGLRYDRVGGALIGDYHGGAVYSIDYGLTWQRLPNQKTFFGHIVQLAVEDGTHYVACGPNNFLARYSLDSTLTSVEEEALTIDEACVSMDNSYPTPCAVYDLLGRYIGEVMYEGPASLRDRQPFVQGQVYIVQPTIGSRMCAIVVLND